MAATDNRSVDGNSMKLSNGYDIEKSITQGGSAINNSQAAVRRTFLKQLIGSSFSL
jgi:hypothetical protein